MGQLQLMPKLGHWFINRKAWPGRRQLDNVPIRVIGIDALEVDSIQNRCYSQASIHELLTPRQLGFFIFNGKCLMVCLSGTYTHATFPGWLALKVRDQGTWSSISHTPVPVRRVWIVKVRGHFHALKLQKIAKKG